MAQQAAPMTARFGQALGKGKRPVREAPKNRKSKIRNRKSEVPPPSMAPGHSNIPLGSGDLLMVQGAGYPFMNARLLLTGVIVCAVTPLRLQAATFVSGAIANQTWIKPSSPYVVIGDVSVARLTIQPGVEVRFASNFLFEIAGGITAVGTKSEPIIFTATNATTGWKGILFNYNPLPSELTYCVVERALNSGIRILGSSPVIRHCVVANNRAPQGAGIFASEAQALLIEDCIITNNISNGHGAGLYCVNTSSSNVLHVRRSLFRFNVANNPNALGGGFYTQGSVLLESSTFRNNAAAYGSGIYITVWTGGDATVRNCIVTEGGGFDGAGAPAVVLIGSAPACGITNSTIAYNRGRGFESGGTPAVHNCIIWANTTEQVVGFPSVRYSAIQGGYAGLGNIAINPVFSNLETLALLDASPCIDAGDPQASLNDACFPPSQRSARNDMGAYGGPGACAWPTAPLITIHPVSQRSCLGCQVELSVEVTGQMPLFYEWRRNGVAITGATQAVLRLGNVTSNDVGAYTVRILNSYGEAVSNPAFLTIAPPSLLIDLYPGLTISGVVGQTHRIEYLPTIGATNDWSFLTNVYQGLPEILWIDPEPARSGQKFYRVLEQP